MIKSLYDVKYGGYTYKEYKVIKNKEFACEDHNCREDYAYIRIRETIRE